MSSNPLSLSLPCPGPVPDVLALGAFLKVTVAVISGQRLHLSPDVGNLDDAEAIRAHEALAAALVAATGCQPRAVAHDLHPDFASTRLAARLAAAWGVPTIPVQHHHAHMAAVAVEHGLTTPFIGLALDGFGLGPGNQAWGGEMLHLDGAGFTRLGHLQPLRQPGGDVAAREPWRMAAAALHALGRGAEIAGRYAAFPAAGRLATLLDKGLASPWTSSAGRLFDAACGLLHVKPVAAFEGEAPMALEAMVTTPQVMDGGWRMADGVLDLGPLLARLADEPSAEVGANLFHGTLAAGLAAWAIEGARRTGVKDVALGGGCFFNRVLRAELCPRLEAAGLVPRPPLALSPGDPAISAGQAWVAALSLAVP